jgi:serine/alanine adding enzyme
MKTAAGHAEDLGVMRIGTADHARADWDAFVAAAGGTHCHLGAWGRIVAEVTGHRPYYLEARTEAGRLVGALPLVHVRSRLFGSHLVSMPFLNYGGPLGTAAARAALCSEAIGLARRLGADLLELRSRDSSPAGLIPVARKCTVVLPLPPTAEELWQHGFRAKLRSQIRRPEKEGMEVRFGSDQLSSFYAVFSRTMRDLGTPVLPSAWFEHVAAAFSDSTLFAVVWWRDTPVAAGCGFFFRGEFEITWAASLREHGRFAPNMLLYWELMRAAIGRGAGAFNFGRCTPGSPTHRFKQQWGGRDEPLPWGAWGRRLSPPNPDAPGYRVARGIWSRLPVPLTARIGPLLARHLP